MKALSLYPRLNYSLSFKSILAMASAFLNGSKKHEHVLREVFPSNTPYFFNYARTGLQFILSQFALGKRVAIQPYTCPTVLEAIRLAGCSIVFVDINDQLLVDSKKLIARRDEYDVIIITHLYGNPASIEQIRHLIKDKLLIEDCSHAFMSQNENNMPVGMDADFSIFSHGFAKFPSAVKGGFVLVNNQAMQLKFEKEYLKLDEESSFHVFQDFNKAIIASIIHLPLVYGLFTSRIKKNITIGLPKQVKLKKQNKKGLCVLSSELESFGDKIQKQIIHAKYLKECVLKNQQLMLVTINKGSNEFMLPIISKNPIVLMNYLKRHGIEVGQHFKKTHELLNHYGYVIGSCSYYESIYDRIVVLPTHYNNSDKVNEKLGQLLLTFDENKIV